MKTINITYFKVLFLLQRCSEMLTKNKLVLRINLVLLSLALLSILSSCKDFLKIDPPKSSLEKQVVFQNNDQATSVLTGIYASMVASSKFASGDLSSITALASLTSDELIGYHMDNIPFYENTIREDSRYINNLYAGLYQSINSSNLVLEGLDASNGVTPPVKIQLSGEALFIRGFSYFYLVNLFGQVPLQMETDYRLTQNTPKATVERIYQQIVTDLSLAESHLSEAYPTPGRVRPNKSTVQALLARTYLYLKDYENAERYASLVIAKTATYNLVGFEAIFLSNSQEAIWQLMPAPNINALEGITFTLQNTPTQVSLRTNFAMNAFEPNDKRKEFWVKSFTNNTGTYYYPYKYKVRSSTTVTEYSMVFRLAEQYLIRAEARINMEKIEMGISDLNIVRNRPVPNVGNSNLIPALPLTLNRNDALLAVEQERKVELFLEWGHRWFDLKRTRRADALLSPIKSKWLPTCVLYPIPQNEVSRNQKITQNDGY